MMMMKLSILTCAEKPEPSIVYRTKVDKMQWRH